MPEALGDIPEEITAPPLDEDDDDKEGGDGADEGGEAVGERDHLGREFLPSSFSSQYTVEEMGLPSTYLQLSKYRQQKARRKVAKAWYDPANPDELITDLEAYIRWHRLFVEWYLKRWPPNRGVYKQPDPRHKYDMIREALAPPLRKRKPARSLIMAPRGSAKTRTLIWEMGQAISIARPNTIGVVSEFNKDRTEEEIQHISMSIVDNKIIHHDFGAEGELYPSTKGKASRGRKWSGRHLGFMNGSTIMGCSVASAHRGRHPDWFVIDDPEKDDRASKQLWRKKFFAWLFGPVMGTLRVGSHVVWVYSGGDEDTCAAYAMRGVVHPDNPKGLDERLIAEQPDPRFRGWTKKNYEMITLDADGNRVSLWPEHISAEGEDWEDTIEMMGPSVAYAEYQGQHIAKGSAAFNRSLSRHGYIHAMDEQGDEYMLDLRTGERKPWKPWIEGLVRVGAVDLADSVSSENDPGALGCVGIDANGVIFVLDAHEKRQLAYHWIDDIVWSCILWKLNHFVIEKLAFTSAVTYPVRNRLMEERAKGHDIPDLHNYTFARLDAASGPRAQRGKERRIIQTLGPLMQHDRLRFPALNDVTDAAGVLHHVVKNLPRRDLSVLYHQIDTYTDVGCVGHDDLIDMLAMCCDFCAQFRGVANEEPEDPNDVVIRNMQRRGFNVNRMDMPMETWGPKEWEEHHRRVFDDMNDMDSAAGSAYPEYADSDLEFADIGSML